VDKTCNDITNFCNGYMSGFIFEALSALILQVGFLRLSYPTLSGQGTEVHNREDYTKSRISGNKSVLNLGLCSHYPNDAIFSLVLVHFVKLMHFGTPKV
jgi:hypothetical protein